LHVVAAKDDEHLVVGGDASFEGAGVAQAALATDRVVAARIYRPERAP